MTVRSGGIVSPGDNTGTRCSIFQEFAIAIHRRTAAASSAGAPQSEYLRGVTRAGGINGALNGVEVFASGSSGKGAGTFINSRLNGAGTWAMAPGGAAGAAPNDVYSMFGPIMRITRPAFDWRDPFAVWEIGCVMGVETPGVAFARDAGLLLHANTDVTGNPVGLLGSSVVPNPNFAGFGVVWKGTNGTLEFISRATPGAALTERVDVATPGTNVLVKVAFRLYQATKSSDAFVRVLVNDAVMLTRGWGAGTVLPTQATYANWSYGLRPFIRQDNEAGVGANIHFARWWVAAAVDDSAFI